MIKKNVNENRKKTSCMFRYPNVKHKHTFGKPFNSNFTKFIVNKIVKYPFICGHNRNSFQKVILLYNAF